MKCIVQRVKYAAVSVDGIFSGEMERGLVVLVGYTYGDDEKCVDFCVDKVAGLRIFSDENDKMNLSVSDVGGNIMLVSNFTLYGDTSKGRRPSFDKSAKPEVSQPLYDMTVQKFSKLFPNLITGKFGADMQISLINDGPVTLTVEKENG